MDLFEIGWNWDVGVCDVGLLNILNENTARFYHNLRFTIINSNELLVYPVTSYLPKRLKDDSESIMMLNNSYCE